MAEKLEQKKGIKLGKKNCTLDDGSRQSVEGKDINGGEITPGWKSGDQKERRWFSSSKILAD